MRSRYLSALLASLALAFAPAARSADASIAVRSAALQLVENVYVLTARMHIPLDQHLREVLKDGVALRLELQIEVSRARSYWPDDSVASLTQQYELRYHAVSERYVVRNLNSGEQATFPTVEPAMEHLTHITQLPVLDRALIRKDREYEGRIRATMAVGSMPAALRWMMFWADDLHRVSDWYTWPLLK